MFRVYGKSPNMKRFSALGSFGNDDVCFVANLFYAFYFNTRDDAEKFADYARSQCPDFVFEVRKFK